MSYKYKNNVAFIIPTRNRKELLSKLLESMVGHSDLIRQIIIVDGSDEPIGSFFFADYPFEVDYVYVNPPSLTRQKNAGIMQLQDDITLAGILDDDIVLYEDTVEKLLDFWEKCDSNTLGSAFNIVNVPQKGFIRGLLARFFYMDVEERGKVLKSGFCSGFFPIDDTISVEWLCGGATIWRREVLKKWSFDEALAGWAYYEDAVFSYEISKKGKLFVIKDARVDHNPPDFNINKSINLGRMLVLNRHHFVHYYSELSITLFYYSTLGEIIINICESLSRRNRRGLLLAYGNILGLWDIIVNERKQVDENFRS